MTNRELLNILKVHFLTNYNTTSFFIYGSYAELRKDFLLTPKDIDVILIDASNIEHGKEIIINIPEIDLPINICSKSIEEVKKDALNLEPKFFSTIFPSGSYELFCVLSDSMDMKTPKEIRHAISNFSSSAYNKGKKKLIVEEDYDEYLGLKNLYHAFKFVVYAMNYYDDINYASSFVDPKYYEIWYLNDIRKLIFNTYASSTGTNEERFKAVDIVIRPLYNALMTKFRKKFPK